MKELTRLVAENLKVRSTPDESAGAAQIPEDLVKRFRVSSGQRVKVSHLNSKADVAVQPAKSVDSREIRMIKADLYKLGAYEGAKVSVAFPH